MFGVKRLYFFILKTFLPLLFVMFSICLFILLMQFLWVYVDEMVGKGIELKVLAEAFFYAANCMFPRAVPIAILLASLMTFGNLGEHQELLAMKSSGISLLRIMKPVIVLVFLISGLSFFYQNNILPGAQSKFRTILYSFSMKKPELEIPVKSFYTGIPGYNMLVRKKDKTGLLSEVMIYDYSNSFQNVKIHASDSGRIKMSDDKLFLILTLYNGISFQNLEINRSRFNQNQIPFQRDTFSVRDVLISFDSNFNMADESLTQNMEISKNVPELRSFIHTASAENDSATREIYPTFMRQVYRYAFKQEQAYSEIKLSPKDTLPYIDFEALYNELPLLQKFEVLDNMRMKIDQMNNNFNFQMYKQSDAQRLIRKYKIELHRKFTLSLACLLFFFIGAPLGAIIRKGGLGFPAVLSIFIFTIYYNIDLFGWKMARQDSWPVWQGMWLSSAVLAPLGIFFTYKAVNDSMVMNPDAWKVVLQRLTGKREMRNYTKKEVIMVSPDYPEAIISMEKWNEKVNSYLKQKKKIPFYISFWKQDFRDKQLNGLLTSMENRIEDLLNSDENLIIGKLMDYPVITPFHLSFLNHPALRFSCSVFLPAGILIYIICYLKQRQIHADLQSTVKINEEISKELRNLKLDCRFGFE